MPQTAAKPKKKPSAPAKPGHKPGQKPKPGKGRAGSAKKPAALTARTADRHELYQLSVQNVESEIDFVDAEFERLRGRKAVRLREDFCGTGNTS